MHLHESFTHERNHIATNEVNELNRIRRDLEQLCDQLQIIIFGQNKEIGNKLMQTKIQNAINIHSIVYLVQIFHHYTLPYDKCENIIMQTYFRRKILCHA